MRYRVTHQTTFSYDEPVSISYHALRLTPRSLPRQTCDWCQFVTTPAPAVSNTGTDYFGNAVTFFTVQEPHHALTVEAQSQVLIGPGLCLKPEKTPPWEAIKSGFEGNPSAENPEACQFMFDSPRCSPALASYAASSFPPGKPLLAGVLHLTERIHRDFKYDTNTTQVTTSVENFFRDRRGVCQDFAHLEIACLRSLGLAARYVSGYLQTLSPSDDECFVGADAPHAWISVYCPDVGWIDVDRLTILFLPPGTSLSPGDATIAMSVRYVESSRVEDITDWPFRFM